MKKLIKKRNRLNSVETYAACMCNYAVCMSCSCSGAACTCINDKGIIDLSMEHSNVERDVTGISDSERSSNYQSTNYSSNNRQLMHS